MRSETDEESMTDLNDDVINYYFFFYNVIICNFFGNF